MGFAANNADWGKIENKAISRLFRPCSGQ